MKTTFPYVMYKSLLPLICMIFFGQNTSAQHLLFGGEQFKMEVGLNFGPTFFLGDLGGHYGRGTGFLKDLNLPETKLLKGAFITVYPADWIGIRLAGQVTYLAGKDAIIATSGEHETYRKERNLDFKSTVLEAYAAIELYPTMIFDKYSDYDPRLKPYAFIGVGIFHFDPMGSLTSTGGVTTWYRLKPLRTEGQGMTQYPTKKPYDLTQMNIPMGLGLKYQLSDRISIGTELLYRKTFTDYIDDVSTTYIDPQYFDLYLSAQDAFIAKQIHNKVNVLTTPIIRTIPGEQRGNPKNDDAYFSTVLKIGVRLGPIYGSSIERNASRQLKCPIFF
jgi:hypothetical protein